MNRNRTTIKDWAYVFLCFYAGCYPLVALLALNQGSENVGSLALQAFQGATVVSLAFFFKVPSFGRVFNLWLYGIVYFAFISVYMALFRAFNEKIVEITYALRFVFWFIFAFALEQNFISPRRVKTLVYCFTIGALIQCLIAIACYAFNLGGGSIYSDINASVGSKYVSSKTVVSFVSLEVILALYWLLKRSKRGGLALFALLLGVSTILFSFNRSGQLGLLVAALWALCWFVRRNRVKLLLASFFAIAVVAVFLTSSGGDIFLERWGQLENDKGSGRAQIADVAVDNLFDPRSPEAFLIGRGYHKTKNLMFHAFGIHIGAHSDLWDFLISYGIVGFIFYVAIVYKFFSISRRIPYDSLERLCCRATAIAFVIMSLVTGVFQGTYAVLMFLFVSHYYLNEALEERKRMVNQAATPLSPYSPSNPFYPQPQLNPTAPESRLVSQDFQENEFEGAELKKTVVEEIKLDDLTPCAENERYVRSELEQATEETVEPNRMSEDVKANADVEDERYSSSESENATSETSEYDETTRCWLQGLDAIYGELDNITEMFARDAKSTDSQKKAES